MLTLFCSNWILTDPLDDISKGRQVNSYMMVNFDWAKEWPDICKTLFWDVLSVCVFLEEISIWLSRPDKEIITHPCGPLLSNPLWPEWSKKEKGTFTCFLHLGCSSLPDLEYHISAQAFGLSLKYNSITIILGLSNKIVYFLKEWTRTQLKTSY